jgi:hypothetical protein
MRNGTISGSACSSSVSNHFGAIWTELLPSGIEISHIDKKANKSNIIEMLDKMGNRFETTRGKLFPISIKKIKTFCAYKNGKQIKVI